MKRDEILVELDLLVKEKEKLRQAQDGLVVITRSNRKAYEDMKEEIRNSDEPFTKMREYELEEQWDEVLQKENELYKEVEMYRLIINKRRDELVEQLKELSQNREG